MARPLNETDVRGPGTTLQARTPAGVDDVATAPWVAPDALQAAGDRYAPVVREVLQVEVAGQVLRDDAWPGSGGRPQDLAVLGPALELGREADTERQSARASADTADDVSTPRVDERREGLNDACTHIGHAGADQASATALLGQADASQAAAAGGRPSPPPRR